MKRNNISILTLSLASGGAEKVISLLLPELVKVYNVYLVLFYKNIHFPIPKEVNIVILHHNKNDSYTRKILNFPRFTFRYIEFVKLNRIDVSISFLTRPNLINGIAKKFNPNLKVIMSERGYPSINYRSSNLRLKLYKILIPILYNNADLVFSNSIYINEDLKKNFGVKKPMRVVYNPVQLKDRKIPSSSKQLRLIAVGSLRPIKNHAMILNSIQNISNVKLTILGDGQLKSTLKNTAKDLMIIQKVLFEGIVSNVTSYLKKHDCFILSSNSEGFPNVVLEAMATGLPVISTNCLSGPLEILNENEKVIIESGGFVRAKYGLMVNVGDIIGLERAIKYFQLNPDIMKKYGYLGYERAKDFDIKSIYMAFEKMIEEL